MESESESAMVCASGGMTSTHPINQMNFKYWGNSGNRGTNGNDTFQITGNVSASYHNGAINGYGGRDELIISDSKKNWNIQKNGSTHFLTTEVDGIFNNKETVSIQLENMEEVKFFDGSFKLTSNNRKKKETNQSKKYETNEYGMKEIFGTNKNDNLKGTKGNDFIWGADGDDTIQGGDGDDNIVGGKGFDKVLGGKGADVFGVDKKWSKGPNNVTYIMDFEDGADAIFVDGDKKGLFIDEYKGDAFLMDQNGVLMGIRGMAGKLEWTTDGNYIV